MSDSRLPRSELPAWNRTIRYYSSRLMVGLLMRLLFRLRVEGRDRLPAGPALLCFNHMSWLDPFLLFATLPLRPRLYLFGPREEDLRVGPRNRLMYWTGTPVPYKPAKNDLLETTRRVQAVFEGGGILAVAGEGRIHAGERALLPLQEGAAYFALRAGVPVVPVALNGLSWVDFRRELRVRFGQPIRAEGRPTSEAIAALTGRTTVALLGLLADAPDPAPPGRLGRWLTELFNDWPEGSRAAAVAAATALDEAPTAAVSGPPVGWARRPGRLPSSGILSLDPGTARVPGQGGRVGASGLSADPEEYRARLADQADTQLDTWAAELMRDVAKRRGIVSVVKAFRSAASLTESEFEHVFASGGGAPATIGHDAGGNLIVPTISLHVLVPGLRARTSDGRARLIDFLVATFDELVYV